VRVEEGQGTPPGPVSAKGGKFDAQSEPAGGTPGMRAHGGRLAIKSRLDAMAPELAFKTRPSLLARFAMYVCSLYVVIYAMMLARVRRIRMRRCVSDSRVAVQLLRGVCSTNVGTLKDMSRCCDSSTS